MFPRRVIFGLIIFLYASCKWLYKYLYMPLNFGYGLIMFLHASIKWLYRHTSLIVDRSHGNMHYEFIEVNNGAGYVCPVCALSYSEKINEGGYFLALKCGHIYCNDCTNVITTNKKCAICGVRPDRRSNRKVFL